MGERNYTVKEAAEEYFQGKVSAREVYGLFTRGDLRGFRVGVGKGRILIYLSSLDAYRLTHENGAPPPAEPPILPVPNGRETARLVRNSLPAIRLNRLPEA
jgi:hypothetical protein